MRAFALSSLLLIPACTEVLVVDDDGGADIQGEEKADGTTGIEVTARFAPGTVDAVLAPGSNRLGYVFYAAEGATVGLEVTRTGSSTGLDTLLKVYGPRLSDGSYPKTLASDDDAGYGKLSKTGTTVAISGFYLVELAAPTAAAGDKARLKLSCTGECTTDAPVAPLGLDIKWYQRAAERRALVVQSYATATTRLAERASAGLPSQWGVVLDIDETTLNNSAYQKRRADLGVGYSPGSWTAWVNEKAAPVLDGALAFTREVKQLGGKVIFVSNRNAAECAPTEANLKAVGVTYDAIYCRTTVSDKNPRFDAIGAGTAAGLPATEVVMFVGDNIQDFPGLSQDLRKQPEAAFAEFGEKYILIPNPMYGSWEKNLD